MVGYEPEIIEGAGGITVTGAGRLVVDGSGISGSGSENAFRRLVEDVSSTSPVFSTLLTLPFNKTAPGNLLVNGIWSGSVYQVSAPPDDDPFVYFRLDLDGIPLDDAVAGWAPASDVPGFVGMSCGVAIQGKAIAVPTGAHTLRLQWRVSTETINASAWPSIGESASLSALAVS